MDRLQVGDTVRVKDGGVTGKIIFISDGFADVKFASYISKVALSELVLMFR